MMSKAIEKIESEMKQNSSNGYVQLVGQFLIQHLNSNPQNIENILNEEKTIIKSLDFMKGEAQKKKTGNFAILTPAEGFGVILKYFGIESEVATQEIPTIEEMVEVEKKIIKPKSDLKKNEIDFDIKLEHFI